MNQPSANIYIGSDSLQQVSNFISSNSFSKIFVLVDEFTLQYCYPKLKEFIPLHHLFQIISGEENKTISSCEIIWQKLTDENADRQSLLINIGGGVISDMGGFASGCYKRGIKFINIPTTLLSMVDASVGGKTGIDFLHYKNQIGLFNEPAAVFIHTGFLKTLLQRELLSGFAEVIKHYLIADKSSFEEISNQKISIENFSWNDIVIKNVAIKSNIVEQDPYEQNIRKALNFGHTIGHAIETYFLNRPHQKLLHGEAVAVGMICESFISYNLNLLTKTELESIQKFILNYFTLPDLPKSAFRQIINLISQDKKNDAKQNRFSLLNGIGNYSINNSVKDMLITKSLNYYNSLLT